MMKRAVRLLALGLLFCARPAAAEKVASHERARLDINYTAPASCPTEVDFLGRVGRRIDEFNQVGTLPDPVIVVSIEPSEGGFVGTFRQFQHERASGTRQVDGTKCSEVADALAVVAAIAVQQHRKTEVTEASSPKASSSQASVEKPVSRIEPVKRKSAPAAEPAKEPLRHSVSSQPEWLSPGFGKTHFETQVSSGKLSLDMHPELDLQAGFTLGLLPGVFVPRYELSAHTTLALTTPGHSPALLAVLPRIRVGVFGPAEKVTGDTTTRVLGAQFNMGVCFTPFYDTTGLVLLGCIDYGGRSMDVTSTHSDGEERQLRGAGDGLVSISLDAKYNLTSLFQLGLRASGESTVSAKHTVVSTRGEKLFDIPSQSLSFTAGLGVHW